MALWKQIGIVGAMLAAVLVAWALWVPSAAPFLARMGLPVAAPEAETAAGPGNGPPGGPGGGGGFGGGPPAVIVETVDEGAANGRISAIGDGRALRSVAVTPLAAGRIVEVAVASGDRIEAGDLIALLDDEAETIGVARAELALEDARTTLERVERLRGTGASTDVQLREAQLALDRARLELRDAELALDRRRIVAPIGGIVGILPVEPGQQVTTSTEVATIDDRSRLIVEFRVPERWVGQLAPGDALQATSLARPELPLEGHVHALDNRIDQASRTLRVQAMIPNEGDVLRAGMAFRIGMSFAGEPHPAVDPLAIQWSSDGSYVWAVRDERVTRVPVRIVQRSSDRVLVAGELVQGERVVTEGVQSLREGASVTVRPAPGDDEGAGLGVSRAEPPVSDT